MPFDRERFMETTYGHPTSEWESTRDWVARLLHRLAQDEKTISYSDLCREMATAGVLSLDPHSSGLAGLLGQVNVLEHEAGHPLISALVVHKSGDWQPGEGFWNFARELGIDPGSGEHKFDFWIAEMQRCYSHWGGCETRRPG